MKIGYKMYTIPETEKSNMSEIPADKILRT